MKKFSDSVNDKAKRYAANQKLYNDIYNLIDEILIPKINGKVSDKISLSGKEKLVEELVKIIENEINKTKISVLDEYKNDPMFFEKMIFYKEEIEKDYEKVLKTIKSVDKESQLGAAEKMIDNFNNKWNNIKDKIGRKSLENKIKELKEFLKEKENELKK